jgi:hypothetical protein
MLGRKLYESGFCESNPDKLEKLVVKLEDALVLRYHDLAAEPNRSDEFQAITRAAGQLRQLKIKSSGRPDSAKPTSTEGVKQLVNPWINWRAPVSRIQAALLVAERAWQRWVFKSLK